MSVLGLSAKPQDVQAAAVVGYQPTKVVTRGTYLPLSLSVYAYVYMYIVRSPLYQRSCI